MSVFDKLLSIDRRWLYLLGWIVCIIPYIQPIGLPIPTSKYSKDWYNYIDDMPDGSTVLYSLDCSLASAPENGPITEATFHQMWNRDFKIVVLGSFMDGPLLFDMILDQMKPAQNYRKVYGEDWIALGWLPEGETGMASLANNVWTTKPRDYYEDRPTSDFPIMQNIRTVEDFDLLITINSGDGAVQWIRQWQEPYDIPVLVGVHAIGLPGMIPYLQSGQIQAVLSGLPVIAEYEFLVRRPGSAITGVDAVSMTHLYVLGVIIIGNFAFFLSKSRGGK